MPESVLLHTHRTQNILSDDLDNQSTGSGAGNLESHTLEYAVCIGIQGRRQDFKFGGATLSAAWAAIASVATNVARGVQGHASPENFEILGCLRHILRQFNSIRTTI